MRLIDADLPMEQMEELLDHHLMMGNFSADSAVSDCIEFLKTAPTVDAEPVRHGHWIKDIEENSVGCSECHTWFPFDSVGNIEDYDPVKDLYLHYCSWCGANMMYEVSE